MRSHSAEGLPAMDKPKFHVTQGGIDAFVSVEFAGTRLVWRLHEATINFNPWFE